MRRSDSSWRKLYPFQSHVLPLGSVRYHYVDEGHGLPVLLVHGNPTWSFYWRHLITALRDRWRMVAPDHVGCGLSDKPRRYRYTLDQHIRNLVSLIKQLDLQTITLVAHDWGGPIGLGAALELPDRFARLILLNTGAFPPPFIPWRLRLARTALVGRLAVQGLNLFARGALRMATAKPERLQGAVRDGLLAPYDSWRHRTGIYHFVRDIPTRRGHPTWQRLAEIERRLPSLADRPALLIWGMRDWCFTAECLERLRQHLPQAEVHRLEDAGHYVLEDAHQQIVPLVRRFLSEHPIAAENPAARAAANQGQSSAGQA